jgi:hypothetical protein
MPRLTRIESEALTLVGRLFSALADEATFVSRRSDCEAWIFRRRRSDEPHASFVCQQLRRAAEARQASREISGGRRGMCAAVLLGEEGHVVGAGPDAWFLVRGGDPARDPLKLPAALVEYVNPALASGAPFLRAMRVRLDDGSGEVAGLLLGVDAFPTGRSRPRHVATLVIWDPSLEATATSSVQHPDPNVLGRAASAE